MEVADEWGVVDAPLFGMKFDAQGHFFVGIFLMTRLIIFLRFVKRFNDRLICGLHDTRLPLLR
jgi:hypothetical protein